MKYSFDNKGRLIVRGAENSNFPYGSQRKQMPFRNFSGGPNAFGENPNHNRSFLFFIGDDMAKDLAAKGWNVHHTKGNPDKGYPPEAFLVVKVVFTDTRHPLRIWQLVDKGTRKTLITEQNVESLDFLEFDFVDLALNRSDYTDRRTGEPKQAIYLAHMVFQSTADDFDDGYENVPVAGEKKEDASTDETEPLPFA